MTTPVGIGLIGAAGRMGLEIATAASNHPDARIVSALEHPDSELVGKDLGPMINQDPIDVIIDADLSRVVRTADVVVDLSLPRTTAAVIEACVAAGKPLLCGTTGIEASVVARFDTAAKQIPVLYATNLSPGITLLTSLVAQAAATLKDGYDIEIVEMHHRNKVDAPSGTALTLAESAAGARGIDLKTSLAVGRSGHTGVRPIDEIGMHAVRGGSVFGDHTVIFASRNERIEFTHRASSRSLFAEGAVRAAIFLASQKPGRYAMKDALGL